MPIGVSHSSGPVFDIDIPEMNAAEALNRLAEQTGSVMLYSYDLARARQANAVHGRYSLLEGLELLLRGTGLSGGLSEKRVVIIAEDGNLPDGKGESVKKRGLLASIVAVLAGSNSVGVRADQETAANLEEVVVTAQKREERLQDVPISVSVLSGRQLDTFTGEGVSESLTLVPGVQIIKGNQTAGTQLSVRGVAASGAFYTGSTPIAYYLDSVPFGLVKSAIVPDPNAFDLQRVEVLRGPQGTLYGASALNGVVRVLTNDADLNSLEFKARTSLSSTEDGGTNYRGDVAFNMPIVEGKLAARAVLGYEYLDGWVDNLVKKDINDATIRNGRLKLNAQPTDKLSIGLTAWFSRADYGAASMSDDEGIFHGRLNQPVNSDYDAYGLKIGYDFAAFTAVSMTSYIDYSNLADLDIGPFGLDFIGTTDLYSKVFAEEIILTSKSEGDWRWSAGGFYRDAKDNLQQVVFVGLPVQSDTNLDDKSKSFAFFGELTRVLLGGKLELTGGLRYFEDEVTQVEKLPAPPANPGDPLLPPAEDTFSKTTPRVVISWHPSDDATVYASYAEGFRSGWNQSALTTRLAPDLPPVDADSLKNYELGAKGSILDGRLSYDSAVYYMQWDDVQQTLGIDSGNNLIAVAGVNGESASGMGFDVAVSAQPIDGLLLAASYSWNDLALDKDVVALDTVIFSKGDRLNYSPEYTLGADASYAFPMGSLEGRLGVNASYRASQTTRLQAGAAVLVTTSDYILIGRANFSVGNPRWTATLFVDNFNDERGTTEGYIFPDFQPRIRPRTTGLQFEYRFE